MKNTKKFVSVVLAFCMLGTTTAFTSMAATTDAETVSGGSVSSGYNCYRKSPRRT